MNCEFWINYDGLQILCGVNTLGASDLLPEPPPFHHPGDKVTTVPRNTFHGIKINLEPNLGHLSPTFITSLWILAHGHV